MKTFLIVLLAVLAVALGVEGYLFFKSQNATPSPAPAASISPATNSQSPQATQPATTFNQLIGKKAAQKCAFSDGTIYVTADGRLRINTNPAGDVSGSVASHLLVLADKTAYSWGEGATTGTKSIFDPTKQIVNSTDPSTFNCQPWTPDESLFVIPSGVTFNDVNQP